MTAIPGWLSTAIFAAKQHRPGGSHDEPSEFSYGQGLTPPGREDVTEAGGGCYHGRTPSTPPRITVVRGTAGQPGGPWIAKEPGP